MSLRTCGSGHERPDGYEAALRLEKDPQLAELVKIAQDAETAWIKTTAGRAQNWSRVSDWQAARYIAAVLERHEAMVRQKIAEEIGWAADDVRRSVPMDAAAIINGLEHARRITWGDAE